MAGSLVQTIRKTSTSEGLDFFPTQPWPTRALLQYVDLSSCSVWEPACGGGHMSEVLGEVCPRVYSSDIYDYGYGDVVDFLNPFPTPAFSYPPVQSVDWIITNPPFKNQLSLKFTLNAFDFAEKGVAILNRLSWMEGSRRYEQLFYPYPPSRIIILTERLGFDEGTCNVGRGGMLPYAWYVWEMGHHGPTELVWTPPGTKAMYTHESDYEKFNRSVVRLEDRNRR
jgi:hypothetical protein